jgi:acyl phosphate:glycerol-3-phosphate acyltransferase
MIWLLIFVLSYLVGSIPWGYLIARSKGVDIRQHGSGNIGTANVLRVMGKKWGYLVFLGDFFKGYLAVKLGSIIAGAFLANLVIGNVIAAAACILGHNYPIWLGFKGGKGIATSAGTVLVLFPPLVFVSFGVVWIAVFLAGRYTSLASLSAVIAVPIAVFLFIGKNAPEFPLLVGFSILASALAIWRHRSNIVRLLNGTENRFGKK